MAAGRSKKGSKAAGFPPAVKPAAPAYGQPPGGGMGVMGGMGMAPPMAPPKAKKKAKRPSKGQRFGRGM